MLIFNKSKLPTPYISLFPPNNIGGIIRLDVFKMSCVLPPMTLKVGINYTAARLFRNKCVGCEFLEPTEGIEQEEVNSPLRTCRGFFEIGLYNRRSCKKNIAEEIETIEINTPTLIWVAESGVNRYRLYAIKKVGGVLYKTPYTIANVYGDGHICWGKDNKNPKNLLEANRSFWTLPFNSDLMFNTHATRSDGDLNVKLTSFKIKDDDLYVLDRWQECDDILGSSCLTAPHQVDGASIWFDPETLNLLPDDKKYKVRRVLTNGEVLEVGAVAWITYIPESQTYLLDFNGFKIIKEKLTIKSKSIVLGSHI